MKKILFILLVITFIPLPLSSENNHHPVNLALFYPISLNQSPFASTYFNLSLLYGNVGLIRGVDISGVASIVNRDLFGVQIAGLYTRNQEKFMGIGITLGLTSTRGIGVGLQFAGIGNMVDSSFLGIQTAGVVNYSKKDLKGIQLAAVNIAGTVVVGQMGILNITGGNTGLQIGLVNIAKRQKGIPFGVANFDKNSSIQWVSFWTNFSQINTGIRFISNNFISEVYIGRKDINFDEEKITVLAFHYGYRFPSENYFLGTDIGFLHVDEDPFLKSNDGRAKFPAFQIRLSLDISVTQWLEIHGGVGTTLAMDRYSVDAAGELTELYFAGISLF
jgi:hypothetical protein